VGILVLVYLIYRNLSKPLSEDTFAEIYVELSLLQTQPELDQKLFLKKRDEIFNKYKVGQKDIDHFIEEYQKKPEKWAGVWMKIAEKLKQKEESN